MYPNDGDKFQNFKTFRDQNLRNFFGETKTKSTLFARSGIFIKPINYYDLNSWGDPMINFFPVNIQWLIY